MRKQTKLVAVLSAAALLAIGASMTSYAAGGWVAEGDNDWVYLDSDGERVTNEWKRSGDNYYYLDEDGLMAKNALIHDDDADAIYYVNENGTKVMNDWVCIENTEDEQPGDMEETPSVLYYHFGSSGKADRASDGTAKKVKNIDGKYYVFDEEGRMLSGWQMVHVDGEEEYYYLGTETEGWAYTGWQKLEPSEKLVGREYDELKWFYFGSNGRAYKDETKYINGKYYTFGEFGVMADDWYDVDAPQAASGAIAYAATNGTSGTGWVLTGAPDSDDNDDEKYWYYLVSVRDGNNIARAVPYNYFGTYTTKDENGQNIEIALEYAGTPAYRAKVIKNRTYIFNAHGQMLTGFVVIDNDGEQSAVRSTADNDIMLFKGADKPYGRRDEATTGGIEGRTLVDGLYYFSEDGGSGEGQMQTGRVAVTQEGETSYYYFEKNSKDSNYGKAYTDAIKDGYLYGTDGKCVAAEDGNSYEVYTLTADVDVKDGSVSNNDTKKVSAGARVVVSRTGKVKKNGSVTIDGIRYTINGYEITDERDIND